MNRLTDRLQLIADQIEKGETIADIGTDHGFLPLYLWEKGISPRVIMCDISEPSLAKAKGAAGAYQFGNELDFRAGDGLKVLSDGEIDVVVIAGMGGVLIRDILAEDLVKSHSFKKFIFQPRNNCGLLRHWLAHNGFVRVRDLLVREGKFICEIIVAEPIGRLGDAACGDSESYLGEETAAVGSAVWEFPFVSEEQRALVLEYAKVKLGIEKKIEAGIMKGSHVDEGDLSEVRERIRYYERLLGLE